MSSLSEMNIPKGLNKLVSILGDDAVLFVATAASVVHDAASELGVPIENDGAVTISVENVEDSNATIIIDVVLQSYTADSGNWNNSIQMLTELINASFDMSHNVYMRLVDVVAKGAINGVRFSITSVHIHTITHTVSATTHDFDAVLRHVLEARRDD